MFTAAFAMFVCGWPGPLYSRPNAPSIAETFTMYLRRAGEAAIAARSREIRMNGAVVLAEFGVGLDIRQPSQPGERLSAQAYVSDALSG